MSAAIILPRLDTTLGAIELGGILATFFFGIVSMQTYNYYRDYAKDRFMLKTLVMTTWSLELIHTVLTWHTIYSLTITFFGQHLRVFTPPRTFYFALLCSILITTTVQIFFAHRIRLFSKTWLVPVISQALSLAVAAGIVVIVVTLCIHNTLEILTFKSFHQLTIAILVITALVDLIIATSMCYHLWRVRTSNFTRTTTIIDTLIVWCIESTIIKSGASVLHLILFLTRNDLLWLLFFLPKASLFSNSMLVTLNGRNRMANIPDDSKDGTTFINFNSAAGPGLGSQATGRTRNVIIQMTRMTETHIDDGNDESATELKTENQCT